MENYEVLSVIGKGSFGVVAKIKRQEDGRILVWKEINYGKMSERQQQQLVSEVNIIRQLRHPNIVRYYDRVIDKKETKIYIIMQYCEGGDMSQMLQKCKKQQDYIAEDVIWKIFTQILLALHECHNRKNGKIFHRDLQPANIFLDAHNNIKLGDFGLSRILSQQSLFAETHVGTPYYMSPQQINQAKYNEKSDIWSAGCLLYEIAALQPPFEATSHLNLAIKIKAGKFQRLPIRYSQDLQKLVCAMLNVDVEKRPNVTDIMEYPHIKLRLKERKLKEKHSSIQMRQQQLIKREEAYKRKQIVIKNRELEITKRLQEIRARDRNVKSSQITEEPTQKLSYKYSSNYNSVPTDPAEQNSNTNENYSGLLRTEKSRYDTKTQEEPKRESSQSTINTLSQSNQHSGANRAGGEAEFQRHDGGQGNLIRNSSTSIVSHQNVINNLHINMNGNNNITGNNNTSSKGSLSNQMMQNMNPNSNFQSTSNTPGNNNSNKVERNFNYEQILKNTQINHSNSNNNNHNNQYYGSSDQTAGDAKKEQNIVFSNNQSVFNQLSKNLSRQRLVQAFESGNNLSKDQIEISSYLLENQENINTMNIAPSAGNHQFTSNGTNNWQLVTNQGHQQSNTNPSQSSTQKTCLPINITPGATNLISFPNNNNNNNTNGIKKIDSGRERSANRNYEQEIVSATIPNSNSGLFGGNLKRNDSSKQQFSYRQHSYQDISNNKSSILSSAQLKKPLISSPYNAMNSGIHQSNNTNNSGTLSSKNINRSSSLVKNKWENGTDFNVNRRLADEIDKISQ